MSYLKELVQNAKQVDGYHGRRAAHFKYLEEKGQEGEKVESNNKNKIIKWGLTGLFVLGGGFVGYKFYKNYISQSSEPSVESQFKPDRPPTRELNQETRSASDPLDEFMDKVPDNSVTKDIKDKWKRK